MRLLLEIILAAALIALAWQKSFKAWVSEAPIIGRHFAATSATPPKSFTGHIYYTDEAGKTYWLDAQGRRHYQP
jgi:hypothetical protein